MKPTRHVLAALALAALLPATAAAAAPRPTPTAPSVSLDGPGSAPAKGDRLTVGVQPATATAPDRRAHFDYKLSPGAVVTDHLAVFNYSAKPVLLKLYARDAMTTGSGGLDVQPFATKPTDIGRWLALAAPEVSLKPRTRVIVPFQLGLPYNATPGDHTGAVVASLTTTNTSKDGKNVQVENRVGLRVYLRVAGTVTRRLAIDGLHATFRGGLAPLGRGPVDVSFTLRNTGNVRLGAHERVRVRDVLGRTVATVVLDDDKVLLPGSAIPVSVRTSSVFGTVRMSAAVTVEPLRLAGDEGPALPAVTATTAFRALPWVPVLVVVTVLGGVLYRRRRRRTNPPREGRHRRTLPPPRHRDRVSAGTSAAVGLATVLGLLALATPSFAAAPAGPWAATLSPAKGADDTPVEVTTSGGCPSPATNIVARVFGNGFPAEGVNVVGNTAAGVRRDSAFRVPLVVTLRDVAREQPAVVRLSGTYRIDVVCRTARDPQPVGTYAAALTFASPTSWIAAKPVSTVRGPVESPGPGSGPGAVTGGSGGTGGSAPSAAATGPGGAVPGVPTVNAPAPAGTGAAASRGGGNDVPTVPIGLGALAVVAAFLLGRRRGRSTTQGEQRS